MKKEPNSDDRDAELDDFRNAVGHVRPIADPNRIAPSLAPLPNIRPKVDFGTDEPPLPQLFSLTYPDLYEPDDVLAYCHPAMSKGDWKEFKKNLKAQADVDLHGLTLDEASRLLTEVIQTCHQEEIKTVLIVHGKGNLQSKYPKLKNAVAYWLTQHPLVLAYHSAPRAMGGAGALIAKVKRQRPTS